MAAEPPSAGGSAAPEPAEPPRRGFLAKAAALAAWAAALLTPAAAAVASFLNPLRVKSQAGEPLRIGSFETLPSDGTPRKFPVITDRTDAWNRFPNQAVGAVYVRRVGDKQVEAVHIVCPHAGCFIEFNPQENIFFCPCHNAHFDLAGKRLDETSPSPRDLDTLEAEVRDGGEIWVKFQNFRTGIPQKVPEA